MEKAFDGFIEWLKGVILETLDKLVQLRLMELEADVYTLKEVAEKLRMSTDTFRAYQHEYEALGFPKELPTKKWKKLAVLNWLADKN
ncbi:hypothetical protein ACERC8_01520 [Streptococcus sp. E29BA]|uniref:hypothetical protein n=1 Tax=Streptococcus sp. E29BA TaxID=3278716 RepID=UPI00359DB961